MRRSVASSGGVDTSGFRAVSVGSEYWDGKKRLTAGILDGLVEFDHWDAIGLASPAMDALINNRFSKLDAKWVDAVSDIRNRAVECQVEAARIRSLAAPTDRMSHAIANQLEKLSLAESRLANAVEELGGFDRHTALRWLGNIGALAGLAEIGSAAMEGDLHQVGVKSSGVIGGLVGSTLGGMIGQAIVTEAFVVVGGAGAVTMFAIPALCAAVGGYVGGKIGEEVYEWAQGNPTANAVLDTTFDTFYDFLFYDSPFAQALDAFGAGDNVRERIGVSSRVSYDFNAALNWVFRRDPLALDLDGGGVETIGVGTVVFDHDGDGVKTGTGWLKADDGWLVRDLNNNGAIDSGAELFGVDTVLKTGKKALDGFAAMQDVDDNADGKLDQQDSIWGQLRVWRDLNQDGITQQGELFTMSDVGVAAINTRGKYSDFFFLDGNRPAMMGTYTKIDGGEGITNALDLVESKFYTTFPDRLPVSAEAAAMPDIIGSGGLRSLQEAMSQSPELLALVQAFTKAGTREESIALIDTLVQTWGKTSPMQAGADQYGPATGDALPSWNEFADQRQAIEMYEKENSLGVMISTLERFNGVRAYEKLLQKFWNGGIWLGWRVVVHSEQEVLYKRAYKALTDSIYTTLTVQTRLADWYGLIGVKSDANGPQWDFDKLESHVRELAVADGKGALLDLLTFISGNADNAAMFKDWDHKSILTELAINVGPEYLTDLSREFPTFHVDFSYATDTSSLKFLGRHVENEGDILSGGLGDDEIDGLDGDDILFGGAGDDTLMGNWGDDLLYGGVGDDTLMGYDGDDIYVLKLGDGRDRIVELTAQVQHIAGTDVIQFGEGISVAQIRFGREGSNLVIKYSETDLVTVEDWFVSNTRVENIKFSDGSVVAVEALLASKPIIGTDGDDGFNLYGLEGRDIYHLGIGNDSVQGANGDDELHGEAGNDELQGDGGSDLLEGGDGSDWLSGGYGGDRLRGGTGNDLLEGGMGDDTYVLNIGDGVDSIIERSLQSNNANLDTLEFGVNISVASLQFNRKGSDLVVQYSEQDCVVIAKWFEPGFSLNKLKFADGSITELDALVSDRGVNGTDANDDFTHYGMTGRDYYRLGSGDDTAVGYYGNDALYGEAGNDELDGGSGDDQLDGGQGDDLLFGSLGADTLVGGAGNDTLQGYEGADTYVLNLGDGQDSIYDDPRIGSELPDVLQFGGGISAEMLRFSRSGADLIVHYSDADAVTLIGWYSYFKIEDVKFADGSRAALADLMAANGVVGTAGDDKFSQSNDANRYSLGEGNDTAVGGSGNDTILGEAGNDCNDPAKPAQVKRLIHRLPQGSSSSAPGGAVDGCRTVSSPQSHDWHVARSRTAGDAHIVPSASGSPALPSRSVAGSAA